MRPFPHRILPPVTVQLVLLALCALGADTAAAQNDEITVTLSASPNPSTTGSYTVSGSLEGARQASFTSYRLREVGSSDPIIYYGITDPASFSFAVSGKAIGTYTYRAQRCIYTPGSSAPPRCENLGDALDVRVVAPNTAPVADAGSDSSVAEGSLATLDGSGSSDADGDSLTYAWTQTSGTTVTLSSATAASPSFTAPELLANQNLVFSLTVNDGTADSTADTVTVTVNADNDAPTANAGSDRTVDAGASVTLSGSGSDPEGQNLTYAWTQSTGTTVSLSGASTASASFTAPNSAATLTFSLTVSDGVKTSPADSVTVTVRPPPDRTPSFSSATVPTQSWTVGDEISELAAPVATGGDGSLTYGASGLPDGVQLMKKSDGHVFSGTPTTAGSGTAVLIVKDNDDDADALRFDWTVVANATPDFGDEAVADKSWTAGAAITAFTLPSATGGDAPVSYGASGLPEGVTVSPSLEVAGTPSETGTGTATLTARDADGDVDTLSFSWTVASPNASTTGTVLSTTPNPTTGQDFNVAGAYSGSRTYYRLTLLETGPWGHSRVWHPAGLPFTQPMTNRVNGAYTYVLAGCYRDTTAILNTAYQVCEQIGDALTVTVAGAETDPVATQLADTYEVRTGHLDDDTLTDLYVRRTSTAAGGGLFQDVILQQAAGGEFTLVAAPPGSANGTKASTEWAVTAAVEVVLNDINLDGFVDILLRGMDGVVTGASDRIVYAPGRQGGPPSNQKTVDDDLKNFLAEVEAWTKNPTFFDTRTTTRTFTHYVPITACHNISVADLDQDSLPSWLVTVGVTFSYCVISSRPVTGTQQVPTNDSPEARGFAGQFEVVGGRIDPGVAPSSAAAKNIDRFLSDMLGTDMLNGHLDDSCSNSLALSTDAFWEWCENLVEISVDILVKLNWLKRDIENEAQPGRELTPTEKAFVRKYGPPESGEYSVDSLRIAPPSELDIEGIRATALVITTEGLREFRNKTGIDGTHLIVWNEDGYKSEGFTSNTDLSDLVHESVHVWQRECEGCVHAHPSLLSEAERRASEDIYYRDDNGPVHDLHYNHMQAEEQAYLAGDRARLDNGLDPVHEENVRKLNGVAVSRQDMLNEINCVEGFFEVAAVPRNCG